MRYQVGLISWADEPPLEIPVDEDVFIKNAAGWDQDVGDLTRARFCDPAAGWVARRLAAPFVRILAVSDATPEEAAAADAAMAARQAANV